MIAKTPAETEGQLQRSKRIEITLAGDLSAAVQCRQFPNTDGRSTL